MAGLQKGSNAFFSLSPADLAKASCFGILRGDIATRWDVGFWRLSSLVEERLSRSLHPIVNLGADLLSLQYGSSALAHTEPTGVPILRMTNLQEDGWEFDDLKYVDLSEREVENYRLKPGDILFNRTNSKELVGKCAVFREEGTWVFASYLIRVRTDTKRLIPDFVADFLSTSFGRLQIDRLSRQIIGMTNINADEIRDLRIPRSAIPSFHETATNLWIALDRCITSAKCSMRGRRRTSGMLGMRS